MNNLEKIAKIRDALKKFDGMRVKVKSTATHMPLKGDKYDYWGPIAGNVSGDALVINDGSGHGIQLCWLWIDTITHIKETKNTLTIYWGRRGDTLNLKKTSVW